MYDWPELRAAHDALWRAVGGRLRAAGIDAPYALQRSRPSEDVWRDPALVLSQTCGYPYATRLVGDVSLVATPVYAVEGCDGPMYSSIVIKRRDEPGTSLADFAGRRFAFNARDSLSGYVALVAAMREAGVAADAVEWIETGGHRESIRAVAEGRTDIAAIDAVCWALAARHEADAVAKLKPLGRTPLRPALPLISAAGHGASELEAIRTALRDALADPRTREARTALALIGIEVMSPTDYAPLASLLELRAPSTK